MSILWGFILVVIILTVICKLTVVYNKGNACLVGKTVIVTGANSGIGYECALEFAARGARVVMAVRTLDIAEACRKQIIEETDNPNIEIIHLDLCDNDSVRTFAREFKKLPDCRLDILVNNAGIALSLMKKNRAGVDITLQANYLGHFLLTHCLADVMKETRNSRIIHVSSAFAFIENLTLENIMSQDQIYGYGNTKLLQIIGSSYFAEKLNEYGITSNAVHPGYTRTNIFKVLREGVRDFIIWLNLFLQYTLGQSSREGANTVLDAALNKKWKNTTNIYMWSCMKMMKPRKCNDKKFCEEIIKKSKELVHLQKSEEL